jgi:hypothetical protein
MGGLSAAALRRMAKAFLAAGLGLVAAHAGAQSNAGDLPALKVSTQAEMVNGCVVALSEPAIRKALERAKAERRDDMTEASIREGIYSSAVRQVTEGICRCLIAEPLGKVQDATSSDQVRAAVDDLRGPGMASLLAHANDLVGHCLAKPLAEAVPPESARRWELLGHFSDGARYVDAASLQVVSETRVKAWIKAVFSAPKSMGDGRQVLAIRSLKIFDCDDDTEADLSLHAYSDPDQQHAVYDWHTLESAAKFEPTFDNDISEATHEGVCERRPR